MAVLFVSAYFMVRDEKTLREEVEDCIKKIPESNFQKLLQFTQIKSHMLGGSIQKMFITNHKYNIIAQYLSTSGKTVTAYVYQEPSGFNNLPFILVAIS